MEKITPYYAFLKIGILISSIAFQDAFYLLKNTYIIKNVSGYEKNIKKLLTNALQTHIIRAMSVFLPGAKMQKE